MLSNLIFSQEEKKEYNWAVKINTLQLTDFVSFPTVQLSVERKINSWSSLNAEFGYQLYDTETAVDTVSLKPKGFKANIEGRIYFQELLNRDRVGKNRFYLGLQLFYRQNQKSSSLSYSRIDDEEGEYKDYVDNFGVKKSARGINLIFGSQFSVTERFIMEPFVALGYMDRNVENPGSEYDEDIHEPTNHHMIISGYDLEHDHENTVNFGLGFRMGYRF